MLLTLCQILDSFKFKEFADGSSNFNEMPEKFSIRVENVYGKGECAYYEKFLIFLQCLFFFFFKTYCEVR